MIEHKGLAHHKMSEEQYRLLEDRLSTIEAAILDNREHVLSDSNCIGGLGDGILGDIQDKEGEH